MIVVGRMSFVNENKYMINISGQKLYLRKGKSPQISIQVFVLRYNLKNKTYFCLCIETF